MARKLLSLVVALSLCFMLVACTKEVKGNGNKETVNRDVSRFSAIDLQGNYQLNVTVGSPQQVSITTDSNLIQYIHTKVKGKTLIVSTQKHIALNTAQPPIISIAVQNLNQVNLSGNGVISINGIKTGEFDLAVNGNGHATLGGNVQDFEVNLNGNGEVIANDLIADAAEVKLDGNGNINVYASKKLTIKLNGSGKVQYYGEPRELEQKINGNGEVTGIPLNAQKNPS